MVKDKRPEATVSSRQRRRGSSVIDECVLDAMDNLALKRSLVASAEHSETDVVEKSSYIEKGERKPRETCRKVRPSAEKTTDRAYFHSVGQANIMQDDQERRAILRRAEILARRSEEIKEKNEEKYNRAKKKREKKTKDQKSLLLKKLAERKSRAQRIELAALDELRRAQLLAVIQVSIFSTICSTHLSVGRDYRKTQKKLKYAALVLQRMVRRFVAQKKWKRLSLWARSVKKHHRRLRLALRCYKRWHAQNVINAFLETFAADSTRMQMLIIHFTKRVFLCQAFIRNYLAIQKTRFKILQTIWIEQETKVIQEELEQGAIRANKQIIQSANATHQHHHHNSRRGGAKTDLALDRLSKSFIKNSSTQKSTPLSPTFLTDPTLSASLIRHIGPTSNKHTSTCISPTPSPKVLTVSQTIESSLQPDSSLAHVRLLIESDKGLRDLNEQDQRLRGLLISHSRRCQTSAGIRFATHNKTQSTSQRPQTSKSAAQGGCRRSSVRCLALESGSIEHEFIATSSRFSSSTALPVLIRTKSTNLLPRIPRHRRNYAITSVMSDTKRKFLRNTNRHTIRKDDTDNSTNTDLLNKGHSFTAGDAKRWLRLKTEPKRVTRVLNRRCSMGTVAVIGAVERRTSTSGHNSGQMLLNASNRSYLFFSSFNGVQGIHRAMRAAIMEERRKALSILQQNVDESA